MSEFYSPRMVGQTGGETVPDLEAAVELLGKRFRLFIHTLREAGEFSPAAHWIKEYQGPGQPFKMIWISKRYEDVWGKKACDYEEHTDFDVWPESVALEFMRNDHAVFEAGKPLWTIENADGIACLIGKYPVLSEITGFQGVAGLAIPLDDIEGLI